ncbi:response regulator [Paenibacillus psychroresistens]|uniref:Response regulator n=1 Tax=Paenibacillus psychroresistens TaxID=1778678 RepID=A0A6B8RWD5_9BACL|nr:response regulator [Paenibacillus psychroresistens]QGQ99418.1 response regulator [Paenibacillus psychroresistens]
MKYHVYVAEDEPPLLRNIIKKINELDGDFVVVGQAFNGEDAYNDIIRLKPDILITDIRMPILDGLNLIKKIKSSGINLICVIISGYEEFEYAKQAIQLGVEDYILKPLSSEDLANVLARIKIKLKDKRHQQGANVLNKVIHFNADSSILDNLNEETYGMVYICINNPLNHFPGSRAYSDQMQSIIQHLDLDGVLKANSSTIENNYWILHGKFPNEIIVVLNWHVQSERNLALIANQILERFIHTSNYVTIAVEQAEMNSEQIAGTVQKLRQMVNGGAVVGNHQVISELQQDDFGMEWITLNSDLEKKLIFFCKNGQSKMITSELAKTMEAWINGSITKKIMEINLKHVIRICCQNSGLLKRDLLHFEEDIEQLFLEYNRMDNIRVEFLKIIELLFSSNGKVDPTNYQQLIERITEYLVNNLDQKISLPETAELFGITESQLSKIFKKYVGDSPIDYLIKLRIEKAKHYILEYPEMMLRDIAEITGFSDQYYFSRVFKSITGKAPTEFRSESNPI